MKKIVRLYDKTDHRGIVIGSIDSTGLNGKPMAGKRNMVFFLNAKASCQSSRAATPTASIALLSRLTE